MAEVEALVEDARTYLDAELNYQKSRAGFLAGRLKLVAGLGFAALYLVLLALVALAVGLVWTLTPLLGTWGAVAVVVLGLFLLAGLLLWRALAIWRAAQLALKETKDG